jgi:AcrR family transcriptional regulator
VASIGKTAVVRGKRSKSRRVRRSPTEARAEILRAVEGALGGTAFSALTVEDVMRRTGMTRSAFYHYFSGLDELALGLLEQFEQAIRASVDPWLRDETGDADPVQATITHLTGMFRVMETHRTAVRAVAQAAGGHPRVYQQWQTRVLDYFIDLTAKFIRRQVALGRSRVADPDKLAQALILMNNAVANDNMVREVHDDPAAVALVLADVWNAAIYGRTS